MDADEAKPREQDAMNYEHDALTEQIIGCAYTVANTLGNGFLEKVYENSLAHELRLSGVAAEQQKPLQVFYKDIVAGDCLADLLVEESVIVELKAAKAIEDVRMEQCLNYLKVTGLKTCLLLNFGTPKIGIKRISL
jgi:GxxExxY protein